MQKQPTLVFQAFVVTGRIEDLTENEIYGQA